MDFLGGVAGEIEFVVGEGRERGILGTAEAEESCVGTGAEGDDLFPGSGCGGGEEAVDDVVDGSGADVGSLGGKFRQLGKVCWTFCGGKKRTSINNGKSSLVATPRDEELCEWIVQVAKFYGAEPGDTGVLIGLLDDLVFGCVVFFAGGWGCSVATSERATCASSEGVEVGDLRGCHVGRALKDTVSWKSHSTTSVTNVDEHGVVYSLTILQHSVWWNTLDHGDPSSTRRVSKLIGWWIQGEGSGVQIQVRVG